MIEHNTLIVEGLERAYSLVTRKNAEVLILLLHSAAGTGKSALIQGGWLDAEEYDILAPWGWHQHPEKEPAINNATCWSSDEEPVIGRKIDDLLFIDKIIEQVFEKNGFKKIVLVGHSNGCAMGFKVLTKSRYKEKVVAAALYGAPWACEKSALNVPILYMTADSDPIRPLNGGARVVTPWFSLTPKPVQATIDDCVLHLACDPQSALIQEQDHYTKMSWDGPNTLDYLIFKNQGHHWPAGKDIPEGVKSIIGPVNLSINATKLTLDFIKNKGSSE